MSAASTPGVFGSTVFNELFKSFNLNCIYLPRKFESAETITTAIKTMNISGCAISNPFKNEIIKYLDNLDEDAAKLSSVNTIKNMNSKLIGYNTDLFGAFSVLNEKINALKTKPHSALILGSGAVTPAVICALELLNVPKITLAARNLNAAQALKKKWPISLIELENRSEAFQTDLLINTIPYSSSELASMFDYYISHSSIVFDLKVSSEPTMMLRTALTKGKQVIHGYEMAVYQLIEQFEIYTGIKIESETVKSIVLTHYLEKP
jgi:shikimate dehydrogenase